MTEPVPILGGEIAAYQAADGAVRVEAWLERDTVWLSQAQMAELFGRERSVITKHVRKLFREGEFDPKSVCAKFAHTAADGKTYLNQPVRLVAATAAGRDLSGDEAQALLAVVGQYNRALQLLDDYDHQRVSKPAVGGEVTHPLGYDEALRIVARLRQRFGWAWRIRCARRGRRASTPPVLVK